MSRKHVTTVLGGLALTAMIALAAGCQAEDDNPEATGAQPSASVSASGDAATAAASGAPTATGGKDVCTAINDILLKGSQKIAEDSVAAIDKGLTEAQMKKQLTGTLAGLANQLKGQVAQASDPSIKTTLEDTITQLEQGAKAADPTKFLSADFPEAVALMSQKCPVG